MAEKKPAAKKPAAKAPAAPAKKPLRPSETKTSGVFVDGVEQGTAGAGLGAPKGAVVSRPSRTINSGKTRVIPKAGTLAQPGTTTKELKKLTTKIKASDAEKAAAKTADRVRKGASEKISAPAPRRTRTGKVAKASPVKTTAVKRTPSARKVQRTAIAAAEQAKSQPQELTAQDYMRPAEQGAKEFVSVIASPSDMMTGYSMTPHSKAMKIVNAIDQKIGTNGANLPQGMSPELRAEVSARMQSVRNSHELAYNAAMKGDPVFAMRHFSDANETLHSVGHLLRSSEAALKTRGLSVKNDIIRPIAQHNDVVNRALYDQKKNMNIDTQSKEWQIANETLTLANENAAIKSGPFAGKRRAKDFRTPDARNPRRGHAILPAIHTLISGAMSYTRAPSVVDAAQKAAKTARFFGDSVELGDTAAVQRHGNELLTHLETLHKATKDIVGARPNFTPQMRDTVTANLDRNLGHAQFRINEILGEK